MKQILLALLLSLSFFGPTYAQSTAFVFQGGLTMGLQKWDNSFNREPLFASHGALSIESVNNDDDVSSLFMQIGYHVKGSATRFRYYNINSGAPTGVATERFEFRNISLILGAKQKHPLGVSGRSRYYYFGGIRGDYTLSTNIDDLTREKPERIYYYPYIGSMRRWMAGASVGGGLEFAISELIGGEIKVSFHPDFTLQYYQPPISNVPNPYPPGPPINLEERKIRNTAFELGFGLRLLRKVVYVD